MGNETTNLCYDFSKIKIAFCLKNESIGISVFIFYQFHNVSKLKIVEYK